MEWKFASCFRNSSLYEIEKEKQDSSIANARKTQVGSGDRSEKIRTYNYPQNRVTDHRIHFTTNHLDIIMEGKLDEVIEALQTEEERKKLEGENL